MKLMNSLIIGRIIKKYNLQYQTILPPQKGFRNTSYAILTKDGHWLNIIIYKSEPGILTKIKNANAVSDFLAAQQFPTRKTLGEVVRLRATPATYSALYTYLPGHAISWDAYTMRHLKLLGGMMSRMHFALEGFSLPALPSVIEVCARLNHSMKRYFSRPEVRQAMRRKLSLMIPAKTLERFSPLLRECRNLPGHQPLHMDFVRGNILFDGKNSDLTISGLLDFEKTAFGPKLFDIARTLAFLLVDCKYKPEEKIRKYFLTSGYNKRGATPYQPVFLAPYSTKTDALEALIDFFLMYDFYKFLAHNPYEFLWQNQHFMATRDLMLRRRLVRMLE